MQRYEMFIDKIMETADIETKVLFDKVMHSEEFGR